MVSKGNKVDLATFMKWGKDGVIGYMTVNTDQHICQLHLVQHLSEQQEFSPPASKLQRNQNVNQVLHRGNKLCK